MRVVVFLKHHFVYTPTTINFDKEGAIKIADKCTSITNTPDAAYIINVPPSLYSPLNINNRIINTNAIDVSRLTFVGV